MFIKFICILISVIFGVALNLSTFAKFSSPNIVQVKKAIMGHGRPIHAISDYCRFYRGQILGVTTTKILESNRLTNRTFTFSSIYDRDLVWEGVGWGVGEEGGMELS